MQDDSIFQTNKVKKEECHSTSYKKLNSDQKIKIFLYTYI